MLRSQSNWQPSLLKSFPDYALLPLRCQDLLDTTGAQFPEAEPLLTGLDQSHATVHLGYSQTITTHTILWIGHKCRIMKGKEKLALQGIWVEDAWVDEFGDALLSDLAGNAFNAGSCVVVVLLSIIGLALASLGVSDDCTARAAAPTGSLKRFKRLASFAPEIDSDSDCGDLQSATVTPAASSSGSSGSVPVASFRRCNTFCPEEG